MDTRPQRSSVQDAEWRVSAELVRIGITPDEDVVLERSTEPLHITDARLNSEPRDTGWHMALWLDDMAQARARREQNARKGRKK